MTLLLAATLAQAGALDQAVEAREAGNYVGAASLLDAVHPLIEPEDEARWQLERGLDEELQWRPDVAEGYYRAAIAAGGEAGVEAHYHLVVVLDDLGRYREATAELAGLRKAYDIAPAFTPVLDMQAGILDIHAGKLTKGVRRVRKALAADAAGGAHAWMAGRSRFALVDAWADAADGLDFDGREGQQKRNLKKRARLIKDAETEMYALFHTEEPEWITASLLRMGRAYSDLALDLAEAAPPKRLDDDQQAIFRTEVAKKAEGPRTKAYNCFEKGVELATRLQYTSPAVQELRAERDQLATVR